MNEWMNEYKCLVVILQNFSSSDVHLPQTRPRSGWGDVSAGCRVKSGLTFFMWLMCLRNKWPLEIRTGEAGILKIILVGSLSEVILAWLHKNQALSVWLIWAQVGLVKTEGLAHPAGRSHIAMERLQSPLLALCLKQSLQQTEGPPPSPVFLD